MVGDGWAGCGREDRLGWGSPRGECEGTHKGCPYGVEARGRDASLAACSGELEKRRWEADSTSFVTEKVQVSLQKEEEAFGFALV